MLTLACLRQCHVTLGHIFVRTLILITALCESYRYETELWSHSLLQEGYARAWVYISLDFVRIRTEVATVCQINHWYAEDPLHWQWCLTASSVVCRLFPLYTYVNRIGGLRAVPRHDATIVMSKQGGFSIQGCFQSIQSTCRAGERCGQLFYKCLADTYVVRRLLCPEGVLSWNEGRKQTRDIAKMTNPWL